MVGTYESFTDKKENSLYSMKIKEQTRKLAAGCSKHCFEVADGRWRGLKRFSKKYYKEK